VYTNGSIHAFIHALHCIASTSMLMVGMGSLECTCQVVLLLVLLPP
jgi:type IV secretory pathway VirB2 component (pilin)